MTLPKKALKYGQLTFAKGKEVPSSGHEVRKATFIDAEGKEKTGFYKPLSSSYPRLLALMVVGVSVAIRNSLGEQAAEDRLVYNDKGELCGTLSIGMKYNPMAASGATLPSNASQQDEVNPSTDTLLKRNVARWLISAWRYKDDDRHPGNTDLDTMLDWDMSLYDITWIIKGARVVDGILKPHPENSMNLKSTELDNFPVLENRTHWPTNTMPGNLNLAKRHMSYEAFRDLAANPTTKLDSSGEAISFQEQVFNAILQELITHEPSTLKARFYEYLGEESLNYLALPSDKANELSKRFPKLFNAESDRGSFVEFMLRVMKDNYNEFYRNTVFYQGIAKNSAGVPVISFHNFLHNRPSSYKKTQAWAAQINERMGQSMTRHEEKVYSNTEHVLDYFCLPEKARYNMKKMHTRYHQVWRDSHTVELNNIFVSIDKLIGNLANELSLKPSLASKKVSRLSEGLIDSSITSSLQLFDSAETTLPKLNCDETNPLGKGLEMLEAFKRELHKLKTRYFGLKKKELTDHANMEFCQAVVKCCIEFEAPFHTTFGQVPAMRAVLDIIKQLEQFSGSFNLCRHLEEKDTPLGSKDQHKYNESMERSHTDADVIAATLKALFDCARAIDRAALDNLINEVIEQKYKPGTLDVMANRIRGKEVSSYIKASKETGDNVLAYILSTGGTESTSLNTLLIRRLIPFMLTHESGHRDINLACVLRAVEKKEFDSMIYTKKAQVYAQKDKRFTHAYSDNALRVFNDDMYKWASACSRREFEDLVNKAVHEYTPYKFNVFSTKNRGSEITGLMVPENNNEKILSTIFCAGKDNSSLSKILFGKVLDAMRQKSYSVAQIDKELGAYIFSSLKEFGKLRLFDDGKRHSSAVTH